MARMQWAKGGGAGGGPGGSSALTTPWAAIILCFPPRWKQGEGARDGGHMRGASGGKMLQGGGGGGQGGHYEQEEGYRGAGGGGHGSGKRRRQGQAHGGGGEHGGSGGGSGGEGGAKQIDQGGMGECDVAWESVMGNGGNGLVCYCSPLQSLCPIPSSSPPVPSSHLFSFPHSFPSPIPLLSSPPLHPSFPHSLIHSRPPIPSPSPKSFLEWRATQQAAAERCNIHQGATSHPLLCFPPFPSSLLPPSLRYPTPSPPPLFPHLPPFIQRGYVDVDAPYNRPSYAMPHPTPPHRTHRTPI
ncbi:unnamed protein product [Closterium sp. NIES-64]|nr:unnamed protein product [Closterium sp. NIES-64]CAI5953141.1 unnamed protein product [Closterium sp. NIES-64]